MRVLQRTGYSPSATSASWHPPLLLSSPLSPLIHLLVPPAVYPMHACVRRYIYPHHSCTQSVCSHAMLAPRSIQNRGSRLSRCSSRRVLSAVPHAASVFRQCPGLGSLAYMTSRGLCFNMRPYTYTVRFHSLSDLPRLQLSHLAASRHWSERTTLPTPLERKALPSPAISISPHGQRSVEAVARAWPCSEVGYPTPSHTGVPSISSHLALFILRRLHRRRRRRLLLLPLCPSTFVLRVRTYFEQAAQARTKRPPLPHRATTVGVPSLFSINTPSIIT
jgi:hypothetical protein